MSRKDAMLRLYNRLVSKRDALREQLTDELHLSQAASVDVGDVGDVAQGSSSSEIDSQLAAFETRELKQVQRAIEMIRKGRYGICEACEQSIPIARLQAVPFTPLCVECQRNQEEHSEFAADFDADWATAVEFEGHLSDAELTLGDLDQDA